VYIVARPSLLRRTHTDVVHIAVWRQARLVTTPGAGNHGCNLALLTREPPKVLIRWLCSMSVKNVGADAVHQVLRDSDVTKIQTGQNRGDVV
jgi:hypothetical protein